MKKYVWMILAAGIGGGACSLGGGVAGITRGAILGLAVALAVLPINRYAGRRIWLSGLFGAGFGLLAGLAAAAGNELWPAPRYTFNVSEHNPLVIVLTCVGVGTVFHLLYAGRRWFRYRRTYLFWSIWGGLTLVGAVRLLPLAVTPVDWLVMLGASGCTMFCWMIGVAIAIMVLDPDYKQDQVPEADESLVLGIAILFPVLVLCFGAMMTLGLGYENRCFESGKHHDELLPQLRYVILFGNGVAGPVHDRQLAASLTPTNRRNNRCEALNVQLLARRSNAELVTELSSRENGKTRLTVYRRSDQQSLWQVVETSPVAMLPAPTGPYVASVEADQDELCRIVFYDARTAKPVWCTAFVFTRQAAWSRDGRVLVAGSTDGKIYVLNPENRTQALVDGEMPSLTADDRLFYWRNGQVYCNDLTGRRERWVCALPRHWHSDWFRRQAVMLVSPDGNFLIYDQQSFSELDLAHWLVLKEARPKGRECLISRLLPRPGQCAWLTPDELVGRIKFNPSKEDKP